MEMKMCRFCRKAFRGFGALCPACVQQLDDKYILARNYLDKNENSNIRRVAEEAGIDEKSLLFLIREGRITLRGESESVTCLKCGTPILSGKYCNHCKEKLMKTLELTINAMGGGKKPEEPKKIVDTDRKGKMHVLKEE
jgi:uncharacterized protein